MDRSVQRVGAHLTLASFLLVALVAAIPAVSATDCNGVQKGNACIGEGWVCSGSFCTPCIGDTHDGQCDGVCPFYSCNDLISDITALNFAP